MNIWWRCYYPDKYYQYLCTNGTCHLQFYPIQMTTGNTTSLRFSLGFTRISVSITSITRHVYIMFVRIWLTQQMWYYSPYNKLLYLYLYTSLMNNEISRDHNKDEYIITFKSPTFQHSYLLHVFPIGNVSLL